MQLIYKQKTFLQVYQINHGKHVECKKKVFFKLPLSFIKN